MDRRYDLSALLRQFGPLIRHISMSPTDGTNGSPLYQGNCRTRARDGYSVEFDDDPDQALAKAIVTAFRVKDAKKLESPPAARPAILPLHENEDTAWGDLNGEDLLGDDDEEDLLN